MARKTPEQLRSHRWFGVDDLRAFGHRSRMLQMGLSEADFRGKPVIGIGGVIEAREKLRSRFEALFQVKPDSLPVSEAMKQGRELLSAATREQLVPWLKKRA